VSSCHTDRFDQDCPSDLFADCEARIADETNQIVIAGQEFDDPILAKADLSQPIGQFRAGAKLTDSNRDPCPDTIQRTQWRAC
jgi:hypothetical protein